MEMPATLETFLETNRISSDDFQKADIAWETLEAIGEDYQKQQSGLRKAAELIAGLMQSFEGVHSVRWRLKDVSHLLEKIVRKRAAGSEKYSDISVENYFDKVTDLLGVRALHLFKDDCFTIDGSIRSAWSLKEKPIAYIRKGDEGPTTSKFESAGFDVKQHDAGYRSVHYVVETRPYKTTISAEVQVRTIFEEGWSEIDHRVRYPNFSDDPLVFYILAIFNRLAGSADEMGEFVRGLAIAQQFAAKNLEIATNARDEALAAVERTAKELQQERLRRGETKGKIDQLQNEIRQLRGSMNVNSPSGHLNIRGISILDYARDADKLALEYDRMRKLVSGPSLSPASLVPLYGVDTSLLKIDASAHDLSTLAAPILSTADWKDIRRQFELSGSGVTPRQAAEPLEQQSAKVSKDLPVATQDEASSRSPEKAPRKSARLRKNREIPSTKSRPAKAPAGNAKKQSVPKPGTRRSKKTDA